MTTVKVAPLLIPRLQQEEEPTQTDMRAIQLWAGTVPNFFMNGSNFGSIPPGNVPIIQLVDTFLGSAISGEVFIDFQANYGFVFHYSYIPFLLPGDNMGGLSSVAPELASSNLTGVTAYCRDNTGAPMTATVRIAVMLIGA